MKKFIRTGDMTTLHSSIDGHQYLPRAAGAGESNIIMEGINPLNVNDSFAMHNPLDLPPPGKDPTQPCMITQSSDGDPKIMLNRKPALKNMAKMNCTIGNPSYAISTNKKVF